MTNLTNLITKGPLKYHISYNETMTSNEIAYHTQVVPQALITLTDKHPDVEVVKFGDRTMGIEIEGKIWAVEDPVPGLRKGKRLTKEVWNYLNLALGDHPNAGWDDGEQTS